MFQIPDNLREALIMEAIEMAPQLRKKNAEALKMQQQRRQEKEKELYDKKIEKLALERKRAIKYHKMYKGRGCWKSIEEVDVGLAALKSDPIRYKALQENIRIQVLGFGWKKYHIKWQKDRRPTPIQDLIDHVKKIIDKEDSDDIPPEPPAEMP